MENQPTNQVEKKPNNSGLKAVAVVLALLLLGSIGYIFKMSSDTKEQVATLTTEKATLENDLKAKIAEYDVLIAEDNELKANFESQKSEMTKLLADIEKSKGDVAAMARYKNEYFRLKKEMDNLVAENELLKAKNIELTSTLDSTNVAFNATKQLTEVLLTQNDTLVSQNSNLARKIEKGAKLSLLNLNIIAVKERGSGKQIETDKASRADKLKVSFLIAENKIAESGNKTYYVQIIDNKSNVLGEKQTIPIGNFSLTYSFLINVKYENKTVQVNEEVVGSDFEPGTYFVNIFNSKGEMVSNTSFNLR